MGIKIITSAKIQKVETGKIILDSEVIEFDKLLVAAGRKANLGLAGQLSLKLDESSRFVKVDENYQTSLTDVYAIGDLIGGYQLAHVASHEGIHAVEGMFGNPQFPVVLTSVPRCLYTSPEVASFGLSEVQAREAYSEVVVKMMPLQAMVRQLHHLKQKALLKSLVKRNIIKYWVL